MFENVTYNFYTTTLGRSAVPDSTSFEALKLENIAFVHTLLPYVTEKATNGIDSATCLMIEEQYKAEQGGTDTGEVVTSENINGYSYNLDNGKKQSLADRKMYWLSLFCDVDRAVL